MADDLNNFRAEKKYSAQREAEIYRHETFGEERREEQLNGTRSSADVN
jgi:hypothetical protein